MIYDFCSKTNCKDGLEPAAGPALDASGNFLGTPHIGGAGILGTVYTLSHGNGWTEQVLYSFCSEQNCTNGGGPGTPVIVDRSGNIYGTTSDDGANGSGGTLFKLTPQREPRLCGAGAKVIKFVWILRLMARNIPPRRAERVRAEEAMALVHHHEPERSRDLALVGLALVVIAIIAAAVPFLKFCVDFCFGIFR